VLGNITFLETVLYPTLFTIGSLQIHAHVFFLVLAIVTAIIVGRKEALRIGLQQKEIIIFFLSVIPLGLLFGYINGLIFIVGFLDKLDNLEHALSGGLVSFGAILGIFLWGYIILVKILKSPIPVGLIMDAIAVVMPLVLGVYRFGCILNGCCHGLETDNFLGLYLPSLYGIWANRYPTQIMLMIFNFALFAWLWPKRTKKPFEGSLALYYLFTYSLGRLLIDSFRDLPRVFGPFSLHQITASAILLISGYILLDLHYERGNSKQESI
jgi:phosphatidylglycerol:prolipoprotein diacylglycerol transferase